MLSGIFTACKASKEVIIKRQEVILRNRHIIHHKLEIVEPLEKFDDTEVELIDLYGSLTVEELAYFQMGEAVSFNAPYATITIEMMMTSQVIGGRVIPFYSYIEYYVSFIFIRV
jgi:hypothetical protein